MESKYEKVDVSLDKEEFFRRYGRKKTVGMFVLGCKVNQYETEALAGLFEKEGYEVVNFDEKADVYVINTCTVTNLSDRKSRQMIRKAKSSNAASIVAVIGCYAQTAPEEVAKIPGVNLILGTKDRSRVVEHIRAIGAGTDRIVQVGNIMHTRDFEELKVENYKERTRAFLKIQEGCSQFCSYCIIPYARGPVRSRRPEEVVREVVKLSEAGFKEIVLTGIHIASYGKDIRNSSLLDIVRKVHGISGIERIRLGSIEPTMITEGFVKTAGELEKLCPHYHISLQSGCDETLRRMNRKYTADEYRRAAGRLREHIGDVSLTTDVMVGFPGETEEEFEETFEFLKEMAFAKMHVFKYSPRKGTPAATLPAQVPPEKKEERSNRVIRLSAENGHAFAKKQEGRTLPVLFEQEARDRPGYIEGLTANYIRVLCKGEGGMKGKLLDVKMDEAVEDYILGEIKTAHSQP